MHFHDIGFAQVVNNWSDLRGNSRSLEKARFDR